IIARKGKSRLWLVAHMDTVPLWIDPEIRNGKIFGRGAVDNKSNIATAITVCNELTNINICFTIGEEKDMVGAKKASTIIGDDIAIVMEPTNGEIYSSQRGAISFIVKTVGKQGHSAYIRQGDSAISKLVQTLAELEKNNWTAFNIGHISGGIATNVIANEAEAHISVRPKTTEEHKNILNSIKKFKILTNIPPRKSNIIKGKSKKTFTEMAFFKNAFIWGIGDMRFAHTAREQITIKELENGPEKLKKLLAIIIQKTKR
ncbi:MAG: M20/M25/M40 family metallo-hydrolase, partial [bacterium]|nr:M20/M25/M40 family metallo-hydrolase [bacterium]